MRGLTMSRSMNLFVLFSLCLATLMSFNVASAAGARRVGKSKYFASRVESEAFCPSALKNLTEWKSSLYCRTMELYKATEMKLGALAEPSGHERFSLFSPFVSCPHKISLTRFGGQADGKNRLSRYPEMSSGGTDTKNHRVLMAHLKRF
jgi:hypothetical protein